MNIKRTRKGDFAVKLGSDERRVLADVAVQLSGMLDGDLDDPLLRRLFPTAYADDPERDREYHALVRDDLADRRRAAVTTFSETIEQDRLSEDELTAWMSAVNDLRLVLGTRLDVSEETDLAVDPEDPDAPLLALYGWLGWLLEVIVGALGG